MRFCHCDGIIFVDKRIVYIYVSKIKKTMHQLFVINRKCQNLECQRN